MHRLNSHLPHFWFIFAYVTISCFLRHRAVTILHDHRASLSMPFKYINSQSLMLTVKAHHIIVCTYLLVVFNIIDTHPTLYYSSLSWATYTHAIFLLLFFSEEGPCPLPIFLPNFLYSKFRINLSIPADKEPVC